MFNNKIIELKEKLQNVRENLNKKIKFDDQGQVYFSDTPN